jgi:hypothetical protein
MTGIGANNPDNALATNNLAIAADPFYRSQHFHLSLLVPRLRRSQALPWIVLRVEFFKKLLLSPENDPGTG